MPSRASRKEPGRPAPAMVTAVRKRWSTPNLRKWTTIGSRSPARIGIHANNNLHTGLDAGNGVRFFIVKTHGQTRLLRDTRGAKDCDRRANKKSLSAAGHEAPP